MSYEPGGRADKLGNRYEGRYVVNQMIRLLKEDIKSITIEAIGDDEKGVDLWLEQNNGIRQAHQCKSRNAGEESWSISSMKSRNIIDHLIEQLNRDDRYEFIFVSSIPFSNLGDICESARNSSGNSQEFYNFQIKISKNRYKIFNEFCDAINFNESDQKDIEIVYRYLKRTFIELFPDNRTTYTNILTNIDFLLTGETETIFSVLSTYAENHYNFGKPIYSDQLWSYLKTQNILPKNLAHDKRIVPTIEKLKDEFIQSIQPLLINQKLIHRIETEQCLKAIESEKNVVLTGQAGCGKSSVLYEIATELNNRKIPFLPLRLDRRIPLNNARQYGSDLGLPESPVLCLCGLTGKRTGVLILDQLDAIRWTGSHSSNAFEVCKELINQSLSKLNEKIAKVIISCRSFDIENDPMLRSLFDEKNKEWEKIEVKSLPESSIRDIVGQEYDEMDSRQKTILSNLQNLFMWSELKNNQKILNIFSFTELLSEYWKFKMTQVEKLGISNTDYIQVISTLVEWLRKNSKISAPEHVLSNCSPNAVSALKSTGILHEQNKRIFFFHQNMLDYLIAKNLFEDLVNGHSILEFLGSKENQTLFCRGQIKEALYLISAESHEQFLRLVKEIIQSEQVRFSIKYLVLELMGQINNCGDSIKDYCIELLDDYYWKNHIIYAVYFGHINYIEDLIKKNLISKWLESENEEVINQSLMLLSSVSEMIPDIIVNQLMPYLNKGESWLKRINQTLPIDNSKDTDSMFDLRLILVKKGYTDRFIYWKELSENNSIRSIYYIEAIVSAWRINDNDSSSPFHWTEEIIQLLTKCVEAHYAKTWELIMPHIERLTSNLNYDYYPFKWRSDNKFHGLHIDKSEIIDLLIKAGCSMAKENIRLTKQWVKKLDNINSIVIKMIQFEVMASIPKKHADYAIKWLIDNLHFLRNGDDSFESEWMSGVRIIKALSQYCSDDIFNLLEDTLIKYHDDEHLKRTKRHHNDWKNGIYYNNWGIIQYLLLPPLHKNRINKITRGLIGVLTRKYENYPKNYFLSGSRSGGHVSSKLNKNLERISDKAWLKIISNSKIGYDSNRNWVQVDDDNIVESSICLFSESLERIAKCYPERFGRLALDFPDNTHPYYISSIINASQLTKPDSNIPEKTNIDWKPAAIETILKVIDKFSNLKDRKSAISFCWLIHNRAEEEWPDVIIDKLIDVAKNHPDLIEGKLNFDCDKKVDEASIGTLFQNTINCVRGVAAAAIEQLLWNHPEWFERLKPGIISLINDPHPVVRMAAVRTLIPIIKKNKDQAVEWFCIASKDDERITASWYGIHFLNYTIKSHYIILNPYINKMINSKRNDVVTKGAEAVVTYYLLYGIFKEEAKKCIIGSIHQRNGAAEAASNLLKERNYSQKCREILKVFFNDPEKDIRAIASHIFYDDFFDEFDNIDLSISFVRSKAFFESSFSFFSHLEKYKESLLPFSNIIVEMCQNIINNIKSNSDSHVYYKMDKITALLLRLYEQSIEQNKGIAIKCMDIWDLFFEKQIGNTRILTNKLLLD